MDIPDKTICDSRSMNTQVFTFTATSLTGVFFTGIIIGYFVKTITKILISVAGGIVATIISSTTNNFSQFR